MHTVFASSGYAPLTTAERRRYRRQVVCATVVSLSIAAFALIRALLGDEWGWWVAVLALICSFFMSLIVRQSFRNTVAYPTSVLRRYAVLERRVKPFVPLLWSVFNIPVLFPNLLWVVPTFLIVLLVGCTVHAVLWITPGYLSPDLDGAS